MAAATASTSAAGAGNEQPNTSLYVHNLNTKTKKPELRRQLYSLFSTYGPVISIVATRAAGMRGQAFVVFRDLSSATAARRALDGFEFYERGLRIEYAREKSKATLLEERGPEGIWDVQAQVQAGKKDRVTYSSAGADRVGRERKRAREEARERGEKVKEDESDEDEEEEEDDEPPAKAAKVAENGDTAAPPPQPAAGGQEEDEEDEDEMDMADSDSDDETGPKPPPA
ncbi:RNA-binding domain-containing protein [Jaminaea rosea]|uniref:RNA-binding domain-containing protein n=1 Tax=Jaminaea rosea TaxID=1569628 RepID=A0A316UPB6_9BASI|nr:RNA-binding domain-containing protein [Jaminaea rosea]PWN27142.1 RNA-binding domain-containing protein [Jaminaea rosea]